MGPLRGLAGAPEPAAPHRRPCQGPRAAAAWRPAVPPPRSAGQPPPPRSHPRSPARRRLTPLSAASSQLSATSSSSIVRPLRREPAERACARRSQPPEDPPLSAHGHFDAHMRGRLSRASSAHAHFSLGAVARTTGAGKPPSRPQGAAHARALLGRPPLHMRTSHVRPLAQTKSLGRTNWQQGPPWPQFPPAGCIAAEFMGPVACGDFCLPVAQEGKGKVRPQPGVGPDAIPAFKLGRPA